MLVGDCMTRDVYTLREDGTVADGLCKMNKHAIHRLPVVNESGELVGIVSDMDLRLAEAAGRLADPVSAVMTRKVVTITEYVPLEEAATIMREKTIGCLPVVRGSKIAGIITDGDIFDVFSRLLGIDRPGVRLTLVVPGDHEAMLDLLQEISNRNGEIVALGTFRQGDVRLMILKIADLTAQEIQRAVEVAGVEIADILTQA